LNVLLTATNLDAFWYQQKIFFSFAILLIGPKPHWTRFLEIYCFFIFMVNVHLNCWNPLL